MGMEICWRHRRTTAWGCPKCRREELHAITAEAIEKMKRDLDAIFEKRKPRRVNSSN